MEEKSCEKGENDGVKASTDATNSTKKKKLVAVKSLVNNNVAGGPWGVGDPYDQSLRKVEKDILITRMIRHMAHEECKAETLAFNDCGKNEGYAVWYKCRAELKVMEDCVVPKGLEPRLYKEAKRQYLVDRTSFRWTGIGKGKTERDPKLKHREHWYSQHMPPDTDPPGHTPPEYAPS